MHAQLEEAAAVMGRSCDARWFEQPSARTAAPHDVMCRVWMYSACVNACLRHAGCQPLQIKITCRPRSLQQATVPLVPLLLTQDVHNGLSHDPAPRGAAVWPGH
jgi:hypothetical protein